MNCEPCYDTGFISGTDCPYCAGFAWRDKDALRAENDAEFYGGLAKIATLWPRESGAPRLAYKYARQAAHAAFKAIPGLRG